MLFQEDLSSDKVPDCHQKRDDDLSDAIVDDHNAHEPPHERIVQDQADDGKDDEDDELATAGHIVAPLEDVTHRSEIVEHDRDRERNGVTDQVRDAEELGERDHEAVIDEEREDTYDAELHELSDEFLHKGPFEQSPIKKPSLQRLLASLFHKQQTVAKSKSSQEDNHNKNEPLRFVMITMVPPTGIEPVFPP